MENWEFFLLGDLNADLTPGIASANAIKLQHILDVCGLDQLITEPIRVTMNSCTLIDHCITNGVVFIDLKRSSTPLIIISSYGRCIYMVLTQSVLSGLSPILSTKVKDVALLANCLMVYCFHVASHRVANLDNFYS